MSEEIKDDFSTVLKSGDKLDGDLPWVIALLCLFGFGLGNSENPRIIELEKKVARLEGQMSMIGGKFHE